MYVIHGLYSSKINTFPASTVDWANDSVCPLSATQCN